LLFFANIQLKNLRFIASNFEFMQELPKPIALNIHESKIDGIFV
jgi:hypothetical protein